MIGAYIDLPKETKESMGYIMNGIKAAIAVSGIPGLVYENEPELNSDSTWKTRISVYNFPDASAVLEFTDMVSDELRMPVNFRINRRA
ncbi:MAG: hypothetical protein JW789_03350 [Candidatus Aenigmarchaeota archaeon]|nr:hypothetical protein [Candidatus Aenigmarchaeota archaeon]